WKGTNGRDVVELDTLGLTNNSARGRDIKPRGAQQGFWVREDKSGYHQEIAIPWELLVKDGAVPVAGDSIVITVEPNFTYGANKSRVSLKDVFRPGVPPDRASSFR